MPSERLKYAVIRVVPDTRRGETVNIGVVVFRPAGLDVRLLPSLHKVRALDPRFDEQMLRDYPPYFSALIEGIERPEQQHQVLANLGSIRLSALGEFHLEQGQDYEQQVQSILSDLVKPPLKHKRVEPVTRLETVIRQQFEVLQLLAKQEDDIDRGMVVPKYPIEGHGNLYVDFALRKERWIVTETIDFSGSPSTLRGAKFKASALKALTLDAAARKLKGETVPLVVYQAATDEILEAVQPSIDLLSDYAQQLYNYADADERAAYFDRIAYAAGQIKAPPY
ncbi:DUF3037 domain-containing protein [Marichromatium gracile]|uniref:DUF3037 family protein n=1 Tax=Marichromatium gracile TaxID=1048 RepID=A0A4R4ABT7_MARGR|nr:MULTISPECIES: DUF3037 domain-containing protein [Marichromatium]MBO8085785.1 DUF3037 domain-containing protein [Marichromatium sp.]MBK1709372.1 hypothetical protein [Marichromatium gracile]MCF1184025.1 DUF3037 domain-containing protein [Marichromatium gracile]RNE88738.1 DUF3037 domain-containing protein [Marichromatium sp. AB31]RNE93177.1 DUF3037 domain-containing protein [Marichromatium sp. AB32]